MSEFIPYARPVLDESDISAVTDVLRGVWLTQGPQVPLFEEKVARIAGTTHAVAVANGTAALHLAYAALGVGAGDEIITSPITFAATANAAVLLGAKVRFADIEPETLTLCPKALENLITLRTKAIVPVDFAGLPCRMDEINAIARKRGIPVVVDAAHSFGATYKDRPSGSLGHMTTFSFHAIKTATAGEGGAVVTNDDVLAARIARLRSHGITSAENEITDHDLAADRLPGTGAQSQGQQGKAPWYYEVQEPAWNYRMTDIQCALGSSQLGRLDTFLASRESIAAQYDAALGDHPLIQIPARPSYGTSAWHLYVVRLDLSNMTATRRDVLETLREAGIGAHVHYIPVHLQPFYRKTHGTGFGDCPNAEAYYKEAVTLPMHAALSNEDVSRVANTLIRAVEKR